MTSSPHRRSVGFLETDGRRWSCFLVTAPGHGPGWRGHFAFRPVPVDEGDPAEPGTAPQGIGGLALPEHEVRTADIFVEPSEEEIERKARALGRPLLLGLLASALHVDRRSPGPGALREPIREILTGNGAPGDPSDPDRLASLYASYRLDQVAHLIALTDPDAFEGVVNRILEEASVDFSTRDRTQLALIVVGRLEHLLPLPPYEVWVLDYLSDPTVYRRYSHALHRLGILDD